MQLHFYKYQGTGNDFVMIDNRTDFFPKNDISTNPRLCDRRFGIGGDGLILLEMTLRLILKWCITIQMGIKVPCAVMEEDV
jgi:diaminopimelate epimerase